MNVSSPFIVKNSAEIPNHFIPVL